MDQREAQDAAGPQSPSEDQRGAGIMRTLMDQRGTLSRRSTGVVGASASAATAVATDTATGTFTGTATATSNGTGAATDTGLAATFRTLLARRSIDPAMENTNDRQDTETDAGYGTASETASQSSNERLPFRGEGHRSDDDDDDDDDDLDDDGDDDRARRGVPIRDTRGPSSGTRNAPPPLPPPRIVPDDEIMIPLPPRREGVARVEDWVTGQRSQLQTQMQTRTGAPTPMQMQTQTQGETRGETGMPAHWLVGIPDDTDPRTTTSGPTGTGGLPRADTTRSEEGDGTRRPGWESDVD
ncbi:hypothetical protein JCM24511_00850 [Saitozyma sp. JCM 24511]|nr:hypothetical protein JCM24511_00850 [Saitozyma sp. JCM 24511]